jgi:uncharacterized membrane protein YqjE
MSSPGPGVPAQQPDPGAGVARDDRAAADDYEYSEYSEPDGRAVTYEGAEPSLGELFGELTHEFGQLVRSEMELARVELKEEAGRAGRAGAMLGAAAAAGYLALALLAFAAAWGLAEVIEPGWAFLVVGLAVGAVAAVLAVTGRNRLREVSPLPDQTVETLKEDARWARAQVT